eukprot:COSAG03_NODE_8_length_24035_cov_36.331885_22_plen_71_part_00
MTEARPKLPEHESEEAVLQFKNYDRMFKAPYVIYADFEALTAPVTKAEKDPSKSYTRISLSTTTTSVFRY